MIRYIKQYNEYILENKKDIFGHDYDNLLKNISDEDAGLTYIKPKKALDNKINHLKKLQKSKDNITLYRIIFCANKEDIDISKIGHHFVDDIENLHEDMLDYLYINAQKENSEIGEYDAWLISIETNTSNIDYHETILTYSLHPNEDEITVIDDTKISVNDIYPYYE
jgi:hypothetical protein